MAEYKGVEIDTKPTEAMAEEAQRGLDWRKEFGRGGTAVGVARARQLVNRQELSADTVKRMASYFARHEVDKEGQGYTPDEDGYPSAGRIAWALWGGNAGQSWANARVERMKKIDEQSKRAIEDEFSEQTITALENKVEEHNEEHGDVQSKRVTLGMLAKVYKRGVGAYNTNPQSVRPSVNSEEQWAMARVNSFLFAVRNGKYRSGKHDTDLLPEGHPMRTEENRDWHEEKRPYPNEHAARITDPQKYEEFARDVDGGGIGIDFIFGISGGVSELQAIRFDADRYSADEARAWLAEHEFEPIEFEEATGGRSDDMEELEQRHVVDVMEDDENITVVFAKHHETAVEEAEEEVAVEERFDRSEMERRSFHFEPGVIDEERRTVRLGVSSEEPVERSFGMEVIDHRAGSMDLTFLNSGRAPLLLDHDMERQIGVVESVDLDEGARRLRATVRFGKGALASEVFTDVVDGIRQNVSVGYRIDGRIEEDDDSKDLYRVRTTPMEISIVSIPADQSNLVGVGRSAPQPLNQTIQVKEAKMADVNLDEVRAEAAKAAAADAHRNSKEIMSLARRHNKADLGVEAIGRGVSIEEFRGELLEVIGNEPLETPVHVVDAPKKQQREYSLSRMINAQLSHDWSKAGFEREMHDEIAARTGKQTDGFYVPDFAFRAGPMSAAATGASGSENVVDNFIPTIHRGDMFVEALRANQVMSNLGVTYLSGLTNRIKMPKFSAGANAAFVEELGNVADQSQTDAGVTLQPRTLGAYVDIGRIALKESIPALDRVVQDDLLRSLAERIEYYAINGSGSSGQPTGLINAGITSVDISAGTDVDALTWADVVALVKAVEDNNAVVNRATQGWLSSPAVKAKLASTAKVGSTDSVMLMDAPWNELYGYPIEFTANVLSTYDPGDGGNDASALIFGDFSQLMVGLFGAPSILVDETTGGLAGTVRIIVHQDVDIALRHTESFAITDEVSVA